MASKLVTCLLPRPGVLRSRPKSFGGPHLKSLLNGPLAAVNGRFWEIPNLSAESRRSANYQPTIWKSEELLNYLESNLPMETCKDKVHLLEGQVRSLIFNETNVVSLLELIDSIQRLGMGYRFKNEIRKSLDKFMALGELGNEATGCRSLHAVALGFRLLRQHGFEVSEDVFNKFTDERGKFVESHGEDIEGLLSLYEASYLAMEGERKLDEAKAFTIMHLKNHVEKINGDYEWAKQIKHALELPLHHRIESQEARWSIEELISRRSGVVDEATKLLLQLAVLDFNLVQSVLRRDLQDVYRWWSDLGLASKLSFSRDRLMESFFWSAGLSPRDPHYGLCRREIAKLTQLITTIDDVYDVYGTQEELVLFTQAVERWDLYQVDDLPDLMKLCFLAFYNTENDMAYKILKEGGEVSIPYLRKSRTDLCKAFLQEAKWVHDEATPSLEEYLDNGWRSASGACILVHAYFLLGQSDDLTMDDKLELLGNYHELLCWPSLIFRLCNDLATSSAELARGETTNFIPCYMNQVGASEEEAREHINKTIEKAWKKINKHLPDKGCPFSEIFVETAINLARISHVHYLHGDSHGAPDSRSKSMIQSLILDPIISITQ